ncbi:MAG: hypothetical protein FWG18_00380 [Alphaproteobacteria bacterium]|nr:hypothetical protein [Alphaproteobacteria bacterium]
MIKRIFCYLLFVNCYLLIGAANATTPVPPVFIQPSIFSTSIDWEAVTGLRLREFQIQFGRDRSVTNVGLELYFLDGFPCYGQTESGRLWVSPSNHFDWDTNRIAMGRITCLTAPKTIQFAYREATRNATQARTTGIMICDTTSSGTKIQVKLNECKIGPDWGDYGRD